MPCGRSRWLILTRPPIERRPRHTAAAVNAKPLASGWDGTGIGVAVIDSGITYHTDLYSTGAEVASSVSLQPRFCRRRHERLTARRTRRRNHRGERKSSNYSTYARTFKGIAPNANLLIFASSTRTPGTDSGVVSPFKWPSTQSNCTFGS